MNYQCPCCGYYTLPVTPTEAIGFICPVCFWENDVFEDREDAPSDCNHSLTLNQARAHFKSFGACEKSMLPHVRPPKQDEKKH